MAKKSGISITWDQAISLCGAESLKTGRGSNVLGNWRKRNSVPADVVLEILLARLTGPRSLSLVREERPPYGLEAETAKLLAPYIRMLAFIREASEGQWEIIKGNIETFYRELGGGKRGARRTGGE